MSESQHNVPLNSIAVPDRACVWRTWLLACSLYVSVPMVFCSHHVTLVWQSIKRRGPLSHQGAMHDCQRLDAQKFAPPRRESLQRGKDSSVTQTTMQIHNDRCAFWLKRMATLYTRLNSKYIQINWLITTINGRFACLGDSCKEWKSRISTLRLFLMCIKN